MKMQKSNAVADHTGPESWHPHLRINRRSERIVRSAMGWLLAYPWFDRLSLWALVKYFFPMSRMWAAALTSQGVPARFFEAVPMSPEGVDAARLQEVLFKVESKRATLEAVNAAWERAFFDPDATAGVEELVAIESARLDRAHALNALRREFRFLRRHGAPTQNPAPPRPDEVETAYGPWIDNRTAMFAAPDPMPQVEVSRKVPGTVGTDYWLRFRSPSARLGDMVYARVHEPEGVANPPTIVFGHGICVDFDHWQGLIDEIDALTAMGVRVIRPEAPFHGRRRPDGRYPGEAIVATTPFGPLDAFSGSIREWSVLLHWARSTSSGALTIGGSSLGALTSLLCADVARGWPEEIRPQAMLLITHCGHQQDALLNGALAEAWKSPQAMEAVGWTPETSMHYIDLLNPSWEAGPVMAPENIITVLGKYDHVTPYASGMGLLDAWKVPQANRIIWKRGHFSVPMTMIRNGAPLKAFRAVLDRLAH